MVSFFLVAHAAHRFRFGKRPSSFRELKLPVNIIDVLVNSEEIGSFNLRLCQ